MRWRGENVRFRLNGWCSCCPPPNTERLSFTWCLSQLLRTTYSDEKLVHKQGRFNDLQRFHLHVCLPLRLPGHTSLRFSLAIYMITLMDTVVLPLWLSKKITEFEFILFVKFSISFHLCAVTAAANVTDIKEEDKILFIYFVTSAMFGTVWIPSATFRKLSSHIQTTELLE